MSEHFTSAEQLKEVFQLSEDSEYEKFTPFTKEIGFSVQRPYPESSKFSPPVKRDGTPDSYALIRVRYGLSEKNANTPHRVPISANIGVFSRYLSNNFDYDFEDDDCPTEESVLSSKRSTRPLDLSFFDEHFYDHQSDSLIDKAGKKVEGIQILNELYEKHLATADHFKGRVFRWKMNSVYKTASLCKPLTDIFKWLLKIICGRTIEAGDISRGFWSEYRPEDLKLLKTERIDVFGYRASKNVIVTFCIILLVSYIAAYLFGYTPKWLVTIGKNNLLSFALAVLSITVLDTILPKFLFLLVNLTIRLQYRLITMNFKFK